MKWSKSLFWVVLHSLLMVVVVLNLLTGLRIATLSYPTVLWFSAILPQGDMHSLHTIGAISLIAIVVGYCGYLFFKPKGSVVKRRWNYHKVVIYWGYLALLALVVSGLAMYFNLAGAKVFHFYSALALLIYLPLHAFVYFVQYGWSAIKLILVPLSVRDFKQWGLVATVAVLTFGLYREVTSNSHYDLVVSQIPLETLIHIDGKVDEAIWQQQPQVAINTFGGSGFVDGQTQVRVKAVHNGIEAFFNISWDDANKSLRHLPLVKTEKGWQVQQNGFDKFDEVEHYEDKFAVILSDNCEFGASGTAHLGPKPMGDRPANFSGKGYHYVDSPDKPLVDLWHWKAVRTNEMILADDNFIGPAGFARAGAKRYTAGYLPDGKEAGAYVMNWLWYKTNSFIVPKRFPKDVAMLADYQSQQSAAERDWVIPWFGYKPYQVEDDDLPLGTVMPSVMYRSNRFEGDRADVRAFGTWQDGQWQLELSRKLDTGSTKDVALSDGICMWVAAFDHSQISHTRHVKPIKLQLRVE